MLALTLYQTTSEFWDDLLPAVLAVTSPRSIASILQSVNCKHGCHKHSASYFDTVPSSCLPVTQSHGGYRAESESAFDHDPIQVDVSQR